MNVDAGGGGSILERGLLVARENDEAIARSTCMVQIFINGPAGVTDSSVDFWEREAKRRRLRARKGD